VFLYHGDLIIFMIACVRRPSIAFMNPSETFTFLLRKNSQKKKNRPGKRLSRRAPLQFPPPTEQSTNLRCENAPYKVLISIVGAPPIISTIQGVVHSAALEHIAPEEEVGFLQYIPPQFTGKAEVFSHQKRKDESRREKNHPGTSKTSKMMGRKMSKTWSFCHSWKTIPLQGLLRGASPTPVRGIAATMRRETRFVCEK
jgi:hypothetical protein